LHPVFITIPDGELVDALPLLLETHNDVTNHIIETLSLQKSPATAGFCFDNIIGD
jgi:hypothetical protein